MGVSKVTLNGVTLMDVTDKTVENDNLLSGFTALNAAGNNVTGTVTVPTKTSDLTNDSGFITSADIPVQSVNGQTGIVVLSIPTATSDLTNDSNFVADASYVHTDNNFTSTEKSKLSGIAAGAEVNQNAFSNIQVGSSTIAADSKTDTLTLIAGNNITLTPNTTSDSITVAADDISSSDIITALGYTPVNSNLIGAVSGIAQLDANGLVPTSQLPSYVDDVQEYATQSDFPATGETGKIYIDISTNLSYRWGGTTYVEISPSLALGTTSSTAFRGDYGNTAYSHATNKGSAFTSGLYKITTNSEGHVTAATAVAKSDITALGIPAQDTTYDQSKTNVGSASNWSAGTLPTLGTSIDADDITAWTAGSVTTATASEGKVTLTTGTPSSLSYTAKSVPNVTGVGTLPSQTVTSTSVVTGISVQQ